jgi:biopolymer transport protein ExbD
MKKILYIIVILVVLGLIFFMFPGAYLKYSITNKLPKEKNSLVYIKPTLKQIDTYLDSGKQYEIGDLLFKVKECPAGNKAV